MSKNKENLIWIDLLRAGASVGVVLIHVAADVITEFKSIPMGDWWAANIYDSLVRGCVALFVMVSGALLLMPTDQSIGAFFKKRANRILLPFLIWTCLYLIWKKLLIQPDLTLLDALRRAAGSQVHFHLWFFYALTGVYLATPVLRLFVRQAEPRHLIYFIALWFGVSSVLPIVEGFANELWKAQLHFQLPVPIAQGLIGYFVLGYFLRVHVPAQPRIAWLLWSSSLAVCVVGMYFLCARLGHYSALLYENTAPNVAVYVAAVFMLAKSAAEPLSRLSEGAQKIILTFSKASFGVYLIHPMIMEAVEKGRWGFVLGPRMPPVALMILLTTAVVYLLSFGAVYLIQKVPFLRRIV